VGRCAFSRRSRPPWPRAVAGSCGISGGRAIVTDFEEPPSAAPRLPLLRPPLSGAPVTCARIGPVIPDTEASKSCGLASCQTGNAQLPSRPGHTPVVARSAPTSAALRSARSSPPSTVATVSVLPPGRYSRSRPLPPGEDSPDGGSPLPAPNAVHNSHELRRSPIHDHLYFLTTLRVVGDPICSRLQTGKYALPL